MKIYETHNLENKELPFICHIDWTYKKGKGFGSSNWHENIEILHIKNGSGVIANGFRHINVRKGDKDVHEIASDSRKPLILLTFRGVIY